MTDGHSNMVKFVPAPESWFGWYRPDYSGRGSRHCYGIKWNRRRRL